MELINKASNKLSPFLLFIILNAVCCLEISVPPKDTIAKVGEDVIMTCEVDGLPMGRKDAFEWERELPGAGDQEHIYITHDTNGNEILETSNPSKYEIEGTYNLVIKNVQLEDGGEYFCRFLLNHKVRDSASLVVVDDVQIGLSNLNEGDTELLSCTVPYGGVLPLSVNPENTEEQFSNIFRMLMNDIVIEDNFQIDESQKVLSLTYEYIGVSEDDNTELRCDVLDMLKDGIVASSVKELTVKHGTTSVHVFSGIEGALVKDKDTFEVGDTLNCTANGDPDPKIMWKQIQGGKEVKEISESSLNLSEDMIGENVWICEASNHYGGDNYFNSRNYTFYVEGSAASGLSSSSASLSPGLIVVAVIVPIAVIAVVVVGAILIIKRRNNTKQTPPIKYENRKEFPAKQLSQQHDVIRSSEEAQPLHGLPPSSVNNGEKQPFKSTSAVELNLESIDEIEPAAPRPIPRRSKSRENLMRSRENLRQPLPRGRESTDGSVMSDSDTFPKLQTRRLPPHIIPDNTSTPRSETPSMFTSDSDADTTMRNSEIDTTLTSNDPGQPPSWRAPDPRQISRRPRLRSTERKVGINVLPKPGGLDTSQDTDV